MSARAWTCGRCGQSWPRDPALEVACPTCHAPIGRHCRKPSGHNVWNLHGGVHADRDVLAMQTVAGYGRCPAASAHRTTAPEDVRLPGDVGAVRDVEIAQPRVADLRRADPNDFSLTAEAVIPPQLDLFGGSNR